MGVNSIGVGGTNAHVIIEEPPKREETSHPVSEFPYLILLSAKCEESLNRRKQDLIDFVKTNPGVNIENISFTLSDGRNHMPHRSYTVASGVEGIIEITRYMDGRKDELISKIAFMFPGHGAQYISMGRDLYHSNKLFRQILDEGFEIIKSEMGVDMSSLLFETESFEDKELKLARIEFAQPALFIIEYALALTLNQIKIKPDYLIGHDLGEYSAACVAGVFDMQSAMKIVIKRAQLMNKMTLGRQMEVQTSYEKLQTLNSHDFEISEFSEYVDQFRMNIPNIPFISCLTGKFITNEQAVSGIYWAQQLLNTVQFCNGISMINENENVVFLEVGPGAVLCSFVKENNAVRNKEAIISTLGIRDGTNESYKIISAMGKMFNLGLEPDFCKQRGNKLAVKISLPAYPFKRIRHWVDFVYPKAFDI
jgi:acyl transferase domain-containing protein